jgi:hypothetical protein
MSASEFLKKAVLQGAGEELGKMVIANVARGVASRYAAGLGTPTMEAMANRLERWAATLRTRQAERNKTAPPKPESERQEGDPATAVFIDDSARLAAQLNSEDKRRILADIVLVRLGDGAESVREIATRDALAALPRVSSGHLRMLGLLWAIHRAPDRLSSEAIELRKIRDANAKAPFDETLYRAADERAAEESQIYADRRMTELAAFLPLIPPAPTDLAQLTVAGAVDVNPLARRDLADLVAREHADTGTYDLLDHSALSRRLRQNETAQLREAWKEKLELCTLTFGGELLGASVHEMLIGPGALLNWEWGDRRKPSAVTSRLPWDGERLDSEFSEKLTDEVKMRLKREAQYERTFLGGANR